MYKRLWPTEKQRARFSRQVREKILLRDQGCCYFCGRPSNIIHHIKFRSQGGRGVETNGVVLFPLCHLKVHRNAKKARELQRMAEDKAGPDYFKDRYDKEFPR
ncbi:MAG: HNH endonuclease [Sporolactobacillus sp.]